MPDESVEQVEQREQSYLDAFAETAKEMRDRAEHQELSRDVPKHRDVYGSVLESLRDRTRFTLGIKIRVVHNGWVVTVQDRDGETDEWVHRYSWEVTDQVTELLVEEGGRLHFKAVYPDPDTTGSKKPNETDDRHPYRAG